MCAVLLDNLFDLLFSLVPIVRRQVHQVDAKVCSNGTKGVKAPLIVDKTDTDTNAAKSSSSANAMQICLGIRLLASWSRLHGNVVVDDHGDTRNVDTTGQQISSNENLALPTAELGEQLLSLTTVEFSVQNGDLVAIVHHAALNFTGALPGLLDCECSIQLPDHTAYVSYLDENNRLSNGHQTVQLAKNIIPLIFRRAVYEHLGDALDSEFFRLQNQTVRIRCELWNILLYSCRERSGEEKHLDAREGVGWQKPKIIQLDQDVYCTREGYLGLTEASLEGIGRQDQPGPTCYQPRLEQGL